MVARGGQFARDWLLDEPRTRVSRVTPSNVANMTNRKRKGAYSFRLPRRFIVALRAIRPPPLADSFLARGLTALLATQPSPRRRVLLVVGNGIP